MLFLHIIATLRLAAMINYLKSNYYNKKLLNPPISFGLGDLGSYQFSPVYKHGDSFCLLYKYTETTVIYGNCTASKGIQKILENTIFSTYCDWVRALGGLHPRETMICSHPDSHFVPLFRTDGNLCSIEVNRTRNFRTKILYTRNITLN